MFTLVPALAPETCTVPPIPNTDPIVPPTIFVISLPVPKLVREPTLVNVPIPGIVPTVEVVVPTLIVPVATFTTVPVLVKVPTLIVPLGIPGKVVTVPILGVLETATVPKFMVPLFTSTTVPALATVPTFKVPESILTLTVPPSSLVTVPLVILATSRTVPPKSEIAVPAPTSNLITWISVPALATLYMSVLVPSFIVTDKIISYPTVPA